jgi:hypothetical protein
MNKQIEHLFNEAGFHKPEMERLGIEHKFEKFAELIVQECVNVLHDNELWNRHISHALKEHFGVEE